MAVEYESSFETVDVATTLHTLTESIGGSEAYALIKKTDNELDLQMTEIHERGLWKDDVRVVLSATKLQIIFRNGNRTQRLEFLALVEKSLSALQLQGKFTEIPH